MNLEAGTAANAGNLELKIRSGDETLVAVTPKLFSSASTSLTITGLFGATGIQETLINLVVKGTNNVVATLNVMVLPLQTVPVGIYTLEYPGSPATQFATAPALTPPTAAETIAVLNDVFVQAGVQFTVDPSSGPKTFAYDTTGISTTNGIPETAQFDSALLPRSPDGRLDFEEHLSMGKPSPTGKTYYDDLFPAPVLRRIVWLKGSLKNRFFKKPAS